jgi:small subunit ribosomal protein S4
MKVVSTCKVCRRVGVSVCGREKCAIKRKPYPPGIHGRAFRRNVSEFGAQLREKQKARLLYGLREKQFKNIVLAALKQKKVRTPEAILNALEARLDNVVYRLGFASTRAAARQLVGHGHIAVNGRRVSIPSYSVSVGDEVSVKKESSQKGAFKDFDALIKNRISPSWLVVDPQKKSGRFVAHPSMEALDEFGKSFNINSVVEYYSR